MYYLRINNVSFGFAIDGVHEIKETDIQITDEEYRDFFVQQNAGKQFKIKENFDLAKGLFGYVEEFVPEPLPAKKTEIELLQDEILANKLAMAELIETIMGGGEIE